MDTKRYVKLGLVMSLMVVLAVSSGCHKKPKAITPTLGGPSTAAPTGGSTGEGLNQNVDLNNLAWQPATDLQKIYFDYNKFTLRSDATQILNANAQKMKAEPANVYWQIEGHCDERGTQEYNLALGEKRALAVREYLITLGVPGDRILTISYGEERPEQDGHDESAWKFNRRAQFNRATK
jgi:peptidoglycan-associated lipoprotein